MYIVIWNKDSDALGEYDPGKFSQWVTDRKKAKLFSSTQEALDYANSIERVWILRELVSTEYIHPLNV